MWSQSTSARIGRVLSAMSQASGTMASVLALIPLFVAVGSGAAAIVSGDTAVAWMGVGAVLAMVLVALLLLFPFRAAMRRLFYGLRLTSVDITLAIDACGHHKHRRTVKLGARLVRTGVRSINDRYCCPGPRAGDPDIPGHAPSLIDDRGVIHGPDYDRDAECWLYSVDLGGPLSAGVSRDIELQQVFDFSGVDYEPRLQRSILDPTDRLVLRLSVPETLWPLQADGVEICPGDRARAHPVTVDEAHREVALTVDSPQFGSVYRLRYSLRATLKNSGQEGTQTQASS